MNYFITAEKEVLKEVSADIYADILRYMIANEIDNDKKNPLYTLRNMVLELGDSLIKNSDFTMDDLKTIKSKLDFIRDFFQGVTNDA